MDVRSHIDDGQVPTGRRAVHPRRHQIGRSRKRKKGPRRAMEEDDKEQNSESCITGNYAQQRNTSAALKLNIGKDDPWESQELSIPCLQFSQSVPAMINFLPDDSDTTSYSSLQLQKQLIHHYTTRACAQLPSNHSPQARFLWEVAFPQMAFQSPPVLQTLIALSAQHLSLLVPNDTNLRQTALKHFTAALSIHRQAISCVTPQNAEVLLTVAVMLRSYEWLSAHSSSMGEEYEYEIPLQLYRMIRGTSALSAKVAQWLSFETGKEWYNNASITDNQPGTLRPQDLVMPWLNPSNDSVSWAVTTPSSTTPSPSISHTSNIGEKFLREAQQDLSRLLTSFADISLTPAETFTYRVAVVELSTLYTILSSPHSFTITELHRRVLNFPSRLPRNFVEALERKVPIAIALLARSLALLCVIGGVESWWIFGVSGVGDSIPARAVRGCARLVAQEWKWTIKWPIMVVNGEIGFEN